MKPVLKILLYESESGEFANPIPNRAAITRRKLDELSRRKKSRKAKSGFIIQTPIVFFLLVRNLAVNFQKP